ncbi:glycosyltransferase family 2 protein [bacterium]|nr:glycosyltransferase family 2 protein [bacterium]
MSGESKCGCNVRRSTISAYIITKNEEKNIGRAIESVRWMDEIIVLDSGSTDNTVVLAEKLDAHVSFAPFNNFVEQKNRAIDLCTGDWVFNLDADEEVTAELRKSIEDIITREERHGDPMVYLVPRKTLYLGRWIMHCGWYPGFRARLSKRGYARWKGEVLHEWLDAGESKGYLRGDLLHRPYNDLGDHLRTIDRYSCLWAQREAGSGRRTGLFSILARPAGKFVKMYILRAGFLDSGPGLIASLMGAWYTFMKYARLYELSSRNTE